MHWMKILSLATAILCVEGGCTTGLTDQQIEQVQTISSDLACYAQSVANATGAGAEEAGDKKTAAIASAASVGFGNLCTLLPQGTVLKTSATVAGIPVPFTTSATNVVPSNSVTK